MPSKTPGGCQNCGPSMEGAELLSERTSGNGAVRKANPLYGLAVMLFANILLCWYPLYQLRNYPVDERPDTSVIAFILAFALSLVTVLMLPLGLIKTWVYCHEVAPPKRTRMLMAAAVMSLAMVAPLSYWVAFFIRVRNAGG
jgi:hypothetical protein